MMIVLTRVREQTVSHALSKPVFYPPNLLYFHKGLVWFFISSFHHKFNDPPVLSSIGESIVKI